MSLLPTALSELFAQVSTTGIITLADRYGLLAALLDESMDEADRMSIDRILYAVHKGRVKVIDELSVVL